MKKVCEPCSPVRERQREREREIEEKEREKKRKRERERERCPEFFSLKGMTGALTGVMYVNFKRGSSNRSCRRALSVPHSFSQSVCGIIILILAGMWSHPGPVNTIIFKLSRQTYLLFSLFHVKNSAPHSQPKLIIVLKVVLTVSQNTLSKKFN